MSDTLNQLREDAIESALACALRSGDPNVIAYAEELICQDRAAQSLRASQFGMQVIATPGVTPTDGWALQLQQVAPKGMRLEGSLSVTDPAEIPTDPCPDTRN